MNKIVVALFIIGFWIFLPIPMMLLDVGGYEVVDLSEAEDTGEIGFINFLGTLGNIFKTYWNLFFFNIPTSNVYIQYFLLFIKSASLLFTILILRGN